MITSKEKSDSRKLPMMPIRDVVIFPHMMTPFVVGRESSVRALEEALAGDRKIFLATQHDASVDEPRPDEIFSVGTVANIVQTAAVGIGLFLPPMGVGLLMALRFADLNVAQHFRTYVPYMLALFVGLLLIICIPAISLTLPRLAGLIR